MNDYDLRQFNKMSEQLEAYRSNQIGLSSLIGDLIFLRDALSDVDAGWERQFTDRVADLESAYAYALEKNGGKLDDVAEGVVATALPILSQLINQQRG